MKQYYLKEGYFNEPTQLDACTLEDAKQEVWDTWYKSGKKTIICVTFKKIKEKEYIVDTD